jgi:hypothetical protein
MARNGSQQGVLGRSKVMDLRSAGSTRANTASMTEMVSAAVFPASRGASVSRDLRSWRTSTCALTNDEIALPVAALGSGLDMLGPFVDGDAILDGILRRSRSA